MTITRDLILTTGERDFLLQSEKIDDVTPETIARRRALYEQLIELPDEALSRLQYLQPQVGCFNRCAFCCQEAGKDLWQFNLEGLQNTIAALAAAVRRRSSRALGDQRLLHRPSVMFPYFDNDIGSYPLLDEYVRLVRDELKCKVRIATVGFSSANKELSSMHGRLANELADSLVAIRFSFTPYTLGWTTKTGESHGTSRAQFIRDFASMLKIYKPALDTIGASKENGICVELRFAPHVSTYKDDILDVIDSGHHIVGVGPHLLVSVDTVSGRPDITTLTGVTKGVPHFSAMPDRYLLVTADDIVDRRLETAHAILNGLDVDVHHEIRPVGVYRFSNLDGPYYAVDPTFLASGQFRALHIYPRSDTRRVSGYTDATRYLLNTLLDYKSASARNRRDKFDDATDGDVEGVIRLIYSQATKRRGYYRDAATHILSNVIPILESYRDVLKQSGFDPGMFFNPDFSIDTGQIVNQGRARGLFRGLVSAEDEPMTPREERGFGENSFSSERGMIWRLAPEPFAVSGAISRSQRGGKNDVAPAAGRLKIQELDPRHLRPIARATGKPLREFTLEGAHVAHVSLENALKLRAFPGIVTIPIQREATGSPQPKRE